jgi:rhomboid family GlyGly-CTERM serine protease
VALIWRLLGLRSAPAVLILIVIVLSLLAGFSSANSLVWRRAALNEGDYWRLLSAHLVHLSPRHMLINLLALWLVSELICKTLSSAQWISLFVVSAIGISLSLWLLQPQLQWYAGLSGVLHGLWSGGAAYRCIIERKRIFLLALLALFVRLMIGAQVSNEFPVIAVAHWYGAFSGLLWLALTQMNERLHVLDYNARC